MNIRYDKYKMCRSLYESLKREELGRFTVESMIHFTKKISQVDNIGIILTVFY